jgi:molecular chaperone GrpE
MAKKEKKNSKPKNEEQNEEKRSEEVSAEETPEVTQEEESLRDQFIRLQADFTNFRNRTQRERTELYQRANEDLFLELLPVFDHYEMGLKTAEEHNADPAVLDGFRMVYDQLQHVLKKFNLAPIDAVGEEFDPHKHEALTHMPSDEYPSEICSQQIRKGYMFGDKLLRPAQVVVSSGPAISEAEEGE